MCSSDPTLLLQTANGNVEAKVVCFYRRRDISSTLIALADKHASESRPLPRGRLPPALGPPLPCRVLLWAADTRPGSFPWGFFLTRLVLGSVPWMLGGVQGLCCSC